MSDTDQQSPSRFIVGVDLGTTNSAASYVDTHEDNWEIKTLPIPQLVAPFQIEERETLPSFHYQSTDAEAKDGMLSLPWRETKPDFAVGVLARDEGVTKPGRLIASAKSWLSHAGVDRTADLLPWQGDAEVEQLSPVEASSLYLEHIRDVWDQRFPKYPLADQDLIVTLPASFDEVARELTVEAAKRAGLPRVLLIEEPQAAFYAWVYRHSDDWHEQIQQGQKILVCDIGGGTTDFTLIRVSKHGDTDDVQFHRVAVGDHLILGGDNLDLTLANFVEHKISETGKLSGRQWDVLLQSARRVKEKLLGTDPAESLTLNLPSEGSKLIGGAIQVEIARAEVEQLLVEGFLPVVPITEKPQQKKSGFQDFGLPFAADPGMSRYLAEFLTNHRFTGDNHPNEHWQEQGLPDPARPDLVLLNGGFFESPVLRERLLGTIRSWFDEHDRGWSPMVLDNARLDLAVSQGAAYYGMVRRDVGVGIVSTLARSYYIGVAGETPQAVCLAPGNAVAGQDFEIENLDFQLTLAEPVEFSLYVSSTRLADPPGDMIEVDSNELKPLPPIRTVLHVKGKREQQDAVVRLHAHLSEIGVLELSCREVDSKRSWRLQFDVRSTTQTDLEAHESAVETEGFVDEAVLAACADRIESVFGAEAEVKPSVLMKALAEELGIERHLWPTSVLRSLWEIAMGFEQGRRKSRSHEARWLNLIGYCLRPGYGFAVDDWRVSQTRKAVSGKIAFPGSQAEALVLWRRIAGGLNRGQQQGLAEPLLSAVHSLHGSFRGKKAKSTVGIDPAQSNEVWRLLGSLELLPARAKIDLGDAILDMLPKRRLDKRRSALVWAIGRLGQRVPTYGPLNTLVPSNVAGRWVRALFECDLDDPIGHLSAMQLARRTEDRHRDLDERARRDVADWLESTDARAHLIELVISGGVLDEEERGSIFGESLPSGLRLR